MVRTRTDGAIAINLNEYDAFIFDLDGVITQTASVHAAAWKKMFDEFLRRRADREGPPFREFDEDADYLEFVDGKPRVDGVRSFLESRGIAVPEGKPDDSPDEETVHGLGRRKNNLFLEHIEARGAKVYDSTVELIKKIRSKGLKTAVISSSKNCGPILKSVRLTDLFDVMVDGMLSEDLGIEGKPAPDIFIEAASRLGVEPARAVVVEDAISGVQAGRQGSFGLVLGIARSGDRQALLDNGADVAVEDLDQVRLEGRPQPALPSALESLEEIARRASGRRITVFLDYDGTLTPIVETPDKAILSDAMRDTVIRLGKRCTIGIISGRDLADVRKMAAIDSIVYAGSHGFDITGPSGLKIDNQLGADFLPSLDSAEKALRKKLPSVPGTVLERKKFAIAVHYRQAAEDAAPAVEAIVDKVADAHPDLRKARGKKIFELQPNMDWHKGKALLSLLKTLKLDGDDVLPIYIGDDVTDEDAFRAIREKGIGIVVWDEPYQTAALYSLNDPEEVRLFLEKLMALCPEEMTR